MRIFDITKTTELTEEPNLELGYLREDTLTIHHEAVVGVEEQGHWVTIAEYPNGGKDVEWVVDVEGVESKGAFDETEGIFVYIPFTEAEREHRRLEVEKFELEQWLLAHDYIGTKIATGRATIEDYAEEIALMSQYADRISEIDSILNA